MTAFDELVFDQFKATSPTYWRQKEHLGETCLLVFSIFWPGIPCSISVHKICVYRN